MGSVPVAPPMDCFVATLLAMTVRRVPSERETLYGTQVMSPRIAASIEPRLLSGHNIWARVRLTRDAVELDVPDEPVLDALDPLLAVEPATPPLDPALLLVIVPPPPDRLPPAV